MLGLTVVCINFFAPLIFSGFLAVRFKNWSKIQVALAASLPIPGLIWIGSLVFILLWAYFKAPASCGHYSCEEDIKNAIFVSIVEFIFFIMNSLFSYFVAVYMRRGDRSQKIEDTFK